MQRGLRRHRRRLSVRRRRPMSGGVLGVRGDDGRRDGRARGGDDDGRRCRNCYWLLATTLATDSYQHERCSSRGLS